MEPNRTVNNSVKSDSGSASNNSRYDGHHSASGFSPVRRMLGPFAKLRLRSYHTRRAARSYSLRISIALLFTALIFVLGTVLIVHSFERHRALALDDASKLFAEVARNTAATAGALYGPVEALVEQTARVSMHGRSLDNLPFSLDYFAESLTSNNQLDSLYLGFDNGDFFLVRRLENNEQSRREFLAPSETLFVVQSIDNSFLTKPLHLTYYYDAQLQLIKINRDFITGFDPRLRPWYRKTINDQRSRHGSHSILPLLHIR